MLRIYFNSFVFELLPVKTVQQYVSIAAIATRGIRICIFCFMTAEGFIAIGL